MARLKTYSGELFSTLRFTAQTVWHARLIQHFKPLPPRIDAKSHPEGVHRKRGRWCTESAQHVRRGESRVPYHWCAK